MPMGTLTLPQNMIEAAYGYAGSESVSVVELFAQLLHSRFGYVMTVPVEETTIRHSKVEISPRVRALRGSARVPKNESYDRLLTESLTERYEGLE